jgi:hypothetical protein
MYGSRFDTLSTRYWYEPHLEALEREGIIKNINNPMRVELR